MFTIMLCMRRGYVSATYYYNRSVISVIFIIGRLSSSESQARDNIVSSVITLQNKDIKDRRERLSDNFELVGIV